MARTIAIIAPFIDTRQLNMDFTLRFKHNNRDLSLAALYELADSGFDASQLMRGMDYGEDIPAAGFYLEGVLRKNGYNTILTNKYDTETFESLAKNDLFAICISTSMVVNG